MAAAIQAWTAVVTNEFEWVDFAMQAPNAMAESLDAAGIDAAVPCHWQGGAEDGHGLDADVPVLPWARCGRGERMS